VSGRVIHKKILIQFRLYLVLGGRNLNFFLGGELNFHTYCSFTPATRTGLEGDFIRFPLRKILSKVLSVYLNLSHDLNILEIPTELPYKYVQCK